MPPVIFPQCVYLKLMTAPSWLEFCELILRAYSIFYQTASNLFHKGAGWEGMRGGEVRVRVSSPPPGAQLKAIIFPPDVFWKGFGAPALLTTKESRMNSHRRGLASLFFREEGKRQIISVRLPPIRKVKRNKNAILQGESAIMNSKDRQSTARGATPTPQWTRPMETSALCPRAADGHAAECVVPLPSV